MQFYGLSIKETFKLRNLEILFANAEIIFLSSQLSNKFDLMDFYVSIAHFLNKAEIKVIFGCFHDSLGRTIRVKVREDFYTQIKLENLMYLVESGNLEAYYSRTEESQKFVGMEIRYKPSLNSFIKNSEMEISDIMRKSAEFRNKYLTRYD